MSPKTMPMAATPTAVRARRVPLVRVWEERGEYLGMREDVRHAEEGEGDEPDQHDRAEEAADAGRAEALKGKQPNKHGESDRHNKRLGAR